MVLAVGCSLMKMCLIRVFNKTIKENGILMFLLENDILMFLPKNGILMFLLENGIVMFLL